MININRVDLKNEKSPLTLKSDHDIISTLTPPSSSGLGRGPLKAETGIRIPVGAFFI